MSITKTVKREKMIIFVEGGIVQQVKSNNPLALMVKVLDLDNLHDADDSTENEIATLQAEFDAMEDVCWP